MRSQSKKTDFPDQMLDSVGDGERRRQTIARLSGDHKHIHALFAGR